MPLPTPQDPISNGLMVRQSTGRPYWQPPVFLLETDVNPGVAGGNEPCWVSGSFASLADGAQIGCAFDLGPDWDQYGLLQLVVVSAAPAVSISNLTVSFRDTPGTTFNIQRAANYAFSNAVGIIFATVATANAAGAIFVRPLGRYLVVQGTNTAGSGAQGAGAKVVVASYPG